MAPHIAITARKDFENKDEVLQRIVKVVEEAGGTTCLDKDHGNELNDFDLIIVVGGDGTAFATVRDMQDLSIPILTIHTGTLGFLSSIDADHIEEKLPSLLRGEGIIDERQLLTVELEEAGGRKTVGRVLNDAVVSQAGISRLIQLHTMIDNEELAMFRADGLIMATPTGSTAYSLAAGGTIVHPRMREHTMILTPINPHSFFQKPILVPGDSDVCVEVVTEDNAYRTIDAVLTMDGQQTVKLERGQRVHTSAHTEHARFLRTKEDSFYRKIREKFQWGN